MANYDLRVPEYRRLQRRDLQQLFEAFVDSMIYRDESRFTVEECGNKGRGLKTFKKIAKNDLIAVFFGEHVRDDYEPDTYLYEIQCGSKKMWINASNIETDAKYINDNHRNPNVKPQILRHSRDGHPYVVFVAKRDIDENEFIEYNYGSNKDYWWRNYSEKENKLIEYGKQQRNKRLKSNDDKKWDTLCNRNDVPRPGSPLTTLWQDRQVEAVNTTIIEGRGASELCVLQDVASNIMENSVEVKCFKRNESYNQPLSSAKATDLEIKPITKEDYISDGNLNMMTCFVNLCRLPHTEAQTAKNKPLVKFTAVQEGVSSVYEYEQVKVKQCSTTSLTLPEKKSVIDGSIGQKKCVVKLHRLPVNVVQQAETVKKKVQSVVVRTVREGIITVTEHKQVTDKVRRHLAKNVSGELRRSEPSPSSDASTCISFVEHEDFPSVNDFFKKLRYSKCFKCDSWFRDKEILYKHISIAHRIRLKRNCFQRHL